MHYIFSLFHEERKRRMTFIIAARCGHHQSKNFGAGEEKKKKGKGGSQVLYPNSFFLVVGNLIACHLNIWDEF